MNITTLTLNPALDKTTTLDKLEPEKKLRCATPKYEPGGGGINVARVLLRLGVAATAVYAAGGATGELFGALLQAEGVTHHAIGTQSWTRDNLTVSVHSTGQQYRFVMPGAPLQPAEWEAFLQYFAEHPSDWIVASGSLPPGVPDDFYARLAVLARPHQAKLVVDTSGAALQQALEAGVYLIKPNLRELSELVGQPELHHHDQEAAARSLVESGKCQIVVVSLGARGAMLSSAQGTFYATPPTVVVRSTVGAGDSMVAGMVWALAQGWPHEQALRYGVACGTATTMKNGTELCQRTDIEQLFQILNPA